MRKIGIDFGTCNIKAAEKKTRDVTAVKLGKKIDSAIIPNVVLYEKNEEKESLYIGDLALSIYACEQDRIPNIKSHLQEAEWKRTLSFGKTISAYDVTFDIMKSIYDDIHNTNKNEELSATITVPVNFSKRQQQVVESAAKNAGFKINAIITEPFASLFYLMNDELEPDDSLEDHNILIFDFGGGTLDLCLAEIKHRNNKTIIQTQATVGITYGGNDINKDILEYLVKKQWADKVKLALDKENLQEKRYNSINILKNINDMKSEMFCDSECDKEKCFDLVASMKDGNISNFGQYCINDVYQMFDEQNWHERLFNLLNNLFENSSSLVPEDITDVFMIGGSSQIGYFRDILTDYFMENNHKDIKSLYSLNDDIDEDERNFLSVSMGAAIYNEIMDNDSIKIRDKIPFMVYSKKENNKSTIISLDACYQEYSSALAPLTDNIKENKKIAIYQNIFGEDNKEVFLGNIEIDDEISQYATLYRLTVDKSRNISADFGYLFDTEDDTEDSFCREWNKELKISIC